MNNQHLAIPVLIIVLIASLIALKIPFLIHDQKMEELHEHFEADLYKNPVKNYRTIVHESETDTFIVGFDGNHKKWNGYKLIIERP